MSITDPTDTIVAQLTDAGRQAFARATVSEISFIFDSFAVGRGGYNPTDPVHIYPIDPTQTGLQDQVFPLPVGSTQPTDEFENPNPQAVTAVCRLAPIDAQFGLGEVGLWCRIIMSNIPSEVGTIFLYALAHMPIQAKTNRHVYVYRFITQF